MFLYPHWPAPSQIKACTTLRAFGDLKQMSDRLRLQETLALPHEPIWLQQVHGNIIVEATDAHRHQSADASFTNQPTQVCAVMTADCLPLLLCDPNTLQIAAIHAGWRGLA
ncbi:MAG TPA: laccase domain-containing protein, partial [Gammaproteobacteria bacterium]|nr:laccase domain-containing protein [Gammaproteobacteria bacterium]